MKLYAERPGRAARQLLADLLALAWLAGFGWAAAAARELMLRLQVPANSLTNAGTSIGDAFAGAARTAAKVPFVGAQLAAALDTGRAAGQSLAGVGEQQLTTIAELATGTAVLVALTAVSVRRLRAVTEDPASGWRRNDPDVVRRLAALELRRLGLRAPR
jgi:hypothetical protein